LQAGPITEQSLQVFRKVVEKNNTYFTRWRNVQIFAVPVWLQGSESETRRQAELARLDATLATQEQQINQLRKPVAHVWTLTTAAPEAPTQLSMQAGAGGVTLAWKDNAQDEAGYLIERSTDGVTFQTIATPAANASRFVDKTSPAGTVYYRVRARNAYGESVSPLISNAWTGTGLKAEYFDNADFTGLKVTRVDAGINFDWQTNAPAPGVAADTYSVRWSGLVQPQASGPYTFAFTSDDGVRLWIDGRKLLDNWADQAPTETTGTIPLEANKKYPIRIEYYNGAGGAAAMLAWSAPGQARALIPATQLYPAP
jgi:hypothetical protein